MNKLTKILNTIITVLVLLFAVLSIVDVKEVNYKTNFNVDNINTHIKELSLEEHSIINKEAHDDVFNYIINELNNYGLANDDTTNTPAYLVQQTTKKVTNISQDIDSILNGQNKSKYIYNETYDLKNIIVSIPANGNRVSNQATMIMAHYDSVPMGPGASDDAVAVSNMLEAIRYYLDKLKNGYQINNDIIFVFTDGEEYGLLGASAFMGSYGDSENENPPFDGFNNLVERIKFAVNLESRGTSGTLIMFETSSNNYNTVKLFSKINENIFTSSIANMVYQMMPNGTDFSTYNEVYQGLNFANLGGGYNYHTQNDNYNNVGKSYLTQQANLIENIIEKTSNLNLNSLYQADNDAIFFSYFNLSTIYYSKTVAYVFACFAILLLMSLIIISIFKKRKNLIKTLKGYIVIAASIVGSIIVSYILYYILSYISALFGIINIHNIGKINYSNIPIVIFLILLTIGITAIINHQLIKILRINKNDVRRAVAYFISTLGILLTFILPVTSYMFIFTGILLLVIELLSLIVSKFNTDDLYLNLFVFGLSLFIIVPIITLASDALGLTMVYALAALSTIIVLIMIPSQLANFKYFTLENIRNIIYKQKNNNFSITTGINNLLLITLLGLFIISISKTNISVNNIGKQNSSMLPYDDALIYVINDEDSKYLIKDLDAFSYLNKNLDAYKYDQELRAYYKKDSSPDFNLDGLSDITLNNNQLTINRNNNNGYIEISFKNNNNINKILLEIDGKTEEYEIENDNYTLRLRSDATVNLLTNGNEVDATIIVSELIINYEPLKLYDDFRNIININQVRYNLINVIKYEK